jgi:exosortase
MAATPSLPVPEGPEPVPAQKPKFDWNQIRESPAFWPGVALFVGILAMYWGLISYLPWLWTNDEYYSHGILVPVIMGFVLVRWWPWLKNIPVKPQSWAILLMIPVIYVTWVASPTEIEEVQSAALLAALLVGVLFIAGWRWLIAMFLPVTYLAFALPLWGPLVDNYTNRMQLISAKMAHQLLELFGFNPISLDTLILVNNFKMDVGVPCSGLKLVIALMAFTIFFVMVGGLKWWGNLIMLASAFPLAIFINGLRIALIGVVGDAFGDEAGHKFHDYSGYITLVVCFIILFKFARLLGWKD